MTDAEIARRLYESARMLLRPDTVQAPAHVKEQAEADLRAALRDYEDNEVRKALR